MIHQLETQKIIFATLYQRPFSNLIAGKKNKELRVDKPKYKKVNQNDIIFFTNAQNLTDYRMAQVLINQVYRYTDLNQALEIHNPSAILPEATTAQDLEEALLRYYSLKIIQELGIVIWDISLLAVHLNPIKKLD